MINQNKNLLAVIVGATGSGKSYAALRLAELTDPGFDIDRVVFNAIDFMRLIDKIDREKLPAGSCIVWDEAGVELGSRDFMTKSNRAISKFLQTFRKMNLGCFFTLPAFNMLDSQARKLAHFKLEPVSIDKDKRKCSVKVFNLDVNATTGKEYHKYPRLSKKGGNYKLKRVNVKLPTVKLRHRYEKKKADFLRTLSIDTQTKIIDAPKLVPKEIDMNKIIDEMIKNPKGYIFEAIGGRKFVDLNVVKNNYNIPRSKAEYIKRMVEQGLELNNSVSSHSIEAEILS